MEETQTTRSGNTITVGTVEVGKTFTAIAWANLLAHRKINGVWVQTRPIIVLDHADNDKSFPDFTVIPMEYLQKDLNVIENQAYRRVRIVVDDDDSESIDEFLKYLIHFQRDTVVLFDDIGNYFTGNLNDIQKKFIKTPKNNGNDYIHVFHTWREPAKKLLAVCGLAIVKQTYDDLQKIEGLPFPAEMKILQEEVDFENSQRPDGEKYATRIFDFKNYKVSVMDMNNIFTTYKGYDYFRDKFKKPKR